MTQPRASPAGFPGRQRCTVQNRSSSHSRSAVQGSAGPESITTWASRGPASGAGASPSQAKTRRVEVKISQRMVHVPFRCAQRVHRHRGTRAEVAWPREKGAAYGQASLVMSTPFAAKCATKRQALHSVAGSQTSSPQAVLAWQPLASQSASGLMAHSACGVSSQ